MFGFSGNDDPNHYRIARHNTRRTSRKEARKQDRNAKKNKKAGYFAHGKKRPAEDDFEAPQSKKVKHHPTQNAPGPALANPQKTAAPVASSSKLEEPSKPKPKIQTKPKPVMNPMKPAREVAAPLPPSRAEAEEDMNIKHLEKLLGYGKNSRKKAQEEVDGLDGECRLPLESLLADLCPRPAWVG